MENFLVLALHDAADPGGSSQVFSQQFSHIIKRFSIYILCTVIRSGSSVGANPTRLTQSLQPVAIEAVVEVTNAARISSQGRMTARSEH
jgi:hypothetical protein